MEVKEYAPGLFCWAELGTTNADSAKKFYTELFDWSFFDSEAGPGIVYTLLRIKDKDVAALYQLSENELSSGAISNWLSYISVASVDETAEKARQLGGKVLIEPLDVQEAGRLAVLQDPFGATFAIWRANKNIGSLLINQIGTACWNELATSDTLASGEFYSKLFGWGKQVQQMDSMEYTILISGDRPAGGMYQISPEMGNMPASWLVYFAVEDCEISVERAKKMGATVITAPRDIPEVGRFAILRDPQGALFAVIKLLNL